MCPEETFDATKIKVIELGKMSLVELIETLEQRLLVYLPEKNIMFLSTFLSGYHIGKRYKVGDDTVNMSEFDRFVEAKFDITTTHGWARNINHLCANPHDACDMFFELFREFKESCSDKHNR